MSNKRFIAIKYYRLKFYGDSGLECKFKKIKKNDVEFLIYIP
jgi:hypothetical protein